MLKSLNGIGIRTENPPWLDAASCHPDLSIALTALRCISSFGSATAMLADNASQQLTTTATLQCIAASQHDFDRTKFRGSASLTLYLDNTAKQRRLTGRP